tara:strand:- start:4812 stop:5537 length:726 start_codon:yes stop_codon:yes gene_type:complete
MSNNEEIEQEIEGKVPDVAPIVDCSLIESDDECIDLMDGEGLKKPEHIEPDEVFKEDKPVSVDAKDTPDSDVKPHKPVKYNKNGTARKPMTADRLQKLAEARKKALETRQRNKATKLQQKKENKIKKIVDDNEVVIVQRNEEVEQNQPQPILYENTKKNRLSREEKDKKIQDAVAEGVKKALESERAERKLRKLKKEEMKKQKDIETKETDNKAQKEKMISNQLNKLNDVDNFYDNCFNFN